ncbi:hypothetical protein XELAEV_18019209mg [Xenopus laevis]|uniref:Uncharacterized protein n=1 Tax=Xenopus laevis TaxID=8355 RepID=A0A974DEK3_XENLA|nr:hypothetical protein XELAEV_18019209mg [Xenopus laevis]
MFSLKASSKMLTFLFKIRLSLDQILVRVRIVIHKETHLHLSLICPTIFIIIAGKDNVVDLSRYGQLKCR